MSAELAHQRLVDTLHVAGPRIHQLADHPGRYAVCPFDECAWIQEQMDKSFDDIDGSGDRQPRTPERIATLPSEGTRWRVEFKFSYQWVGRYRRLDVWNVHRPRVTVIREQAWICVLPILPIHITKTTIRFWAKP